MKSVAIQQRLNSSEYYSQLDIIRNGKEDNPWTIVVYLDSVSPTEFVVYMRSLYNLRNTILGKICE